MAYDDEPSDLVAQNLLQIAEILRQNRVLPGRARCPGCFGQGHITTFQGGTWTAHTCRSCGGVGTLPVLPA